MLSFYYDLKLGLGCNLCKDLSKKVGMSQLVKFKNTDKYLQLHILLQLKDLRADQREEPCIRINTRELNRELHTGLSTLYTKRLWSMLIINTPALMSMP